MTISNTVLKYDHEDVNCLKCGSGVLNTSCNFTKPGTRHTQNIHYRSEEIAFSEPERPLNYIATDLSATVCNIT